MSKAIDITGQKFGKLTALKQVTINGGYAGWLCKCDCGNERVFRRQNLVSKQGASKHCGCERNLIQFRDITGEKFGRLTAIKRTKRSNGNTYWLTKCECGNEKETSLTNLNSGSCQSCGCLNAESARKLIGRYREKHFLYEGKDFTKGRYGKLTPVRLVQKCGDGGKWECICDCGNTKITFGKYLLNGDAVSCGCLRERRAEKHPLWKGGRKNYKGYVLIYNSERKTYEPEHRLVMAKMIGRDLLPSENVHHINGIRNDNRPENLELWVKPQTPGQRASDLVKFAREILKTYGDLFPE